LLVVFVALYVVVRLLGVLLRLPRGWHAWRGRRHRVQGDAAVTRALVALAAGDGGGARGEAARARRLLGDTGQTLLLAAEAARLAEREPEAEATYRLLAGRRDAAFLGLRGQFRLAMARQDFPVASRLAREAEAAYPGGSWLRAERERLAVRSGDWRGALALADANAPKAALATAAANATQDPVAALKLAEMAWKADPGLAPAALAYASRLRAAGKERRALAVIRQSWARAPQKMQRCDITPTRSRARPLHFFRPCSIDGADARREAIGDRCVRHSRYLRFSRPRGLDRRAKITAVESSSGSILSGKARESVLSYHATAATSK